MICLGCKKHKNSKEFSISWIYCDKCQTKFITECEAMNTAVCVSCGTRHPLHRFPRNEKQSGGLSLLCYTCTAKRKRKEDYRRKHPVKNGPMCGGKHCNICGCLKLNECFKKNRKIKGGLHPTCNACLKLKANRRNTNAKQ